MTFQEKFDALKNTYGPTADFSAVEDFLAAQIRMTDADCHGTFYITCSNGSFAIEPYDYHDNTVDIGIESSLLEEMLDGKTDPVAAFLEGKFELNGNAEHALALINALKKKPQPTTRKAKADLPVAEKNTVVKKEAPAGKKAVSDEDAAAEKKGTLGKETKTAKKETAAKKTKTVKKTETPKKEATVKKTPTEKKAVSSGK